MPRLDPAAERKLIEFALALVDVSRARVAVPPLRPSAGYWFGGGNLTVGHDGALYLVGRFRNPGDSRTGLAGGERGLALAIFRSADDGRTFEEVLRFGKAELSQPGREVLSIEGSALHWSAGGVELFVSSEKAGIGYPSGLEPFLKPGCGVWTIERLTAPTLDGLRLAAPETILSSRDPEHLHLKDPRSYESPDGFLLMFCTHPYCWSSSNTAMVRRRGDRPSWESPQFGVFPRGTTWDVAIARGTCLVDVPAVGPFREVSVTLLFYDGGECVRNLDEHASAVRRPRGYSCEELGGLAYLVAGELSPMYRLSTTRPLFVSPYGTGCNRYVDVLRTPAGFHATWQQSQADHSQPLVMTFLDAAAAQRVLSA